MQSQIYANMVAVKRVFRKVFGHLTSIGKMVFIHRPWFLNLMTMFQGPVLC